MLKKNLTLVFVLVGVCGSGFLFYGCSTGVEDSPDPGILRITLQSNPVDTFIVIVNDTFSVSQGDSFGVTIFQGKVYSGNTFAFLFEDTNSYRIQDVTYNVIRMENGNYKQFVIYESYVPPVEYDRLQFGVTADLLKIGNFFIPVKFPEGYSPLLDLYEDFSVFENKVTEINIQVSPFKSVQRYRDSYHFTPVVEIINVTYF